MPKRSPIPRPLPRPRPRPRREPVNDGRGSIPDATLVSKGNERVFGNHCIGLVRRAWGLPTIQRFARPSQGVIDMHDGDRGATPNQRGLARVWDYGAAMVAGAKQEQDGARARLIDFFAKQRHPEGHQYAEPNTSSHGQLWPIIAACAHALALHHQDEALLAVTGEWWRCEADLCDKLIDHDGHRTGPCGRSAGATYDLGTVIAHTLRGTTAPETSLIPNARGGPRPLIGRGFWADSYNFGAAAIVAMIDRGDDLGGAVKGERSPVRLRDPLRIYRRGDEYVKVFPYARSSEFLFWCARLNKRPSVECIEASPDRYEAPHRGGRFPQGIANPYPAPELPGASLVIVPGVHNR